MGINIFRNYGHKTPAETLLEKFIAHQDDDTNPFIIQISTQLIVVKIKEQDHHWWSPEMNIRIESEQNESKISEVIGPNSSAFTFAMFLILIGAVSFLASMMMSLAQIQLGNSPDLALPAAVLSGLLIVATFGVLAMGRIKARDQVNGLRTFVQDIMG